MRPGRWRRIARTALAEAIPSYDSLQSPLHAALAILPFQLEPALAVVRGLASRVLIADEVGLGKTVQAGLVISEILMRRPDARVLVVAPAGLREQWQVELGERFGLGSTRLDSPAIARQAVQHDNPWSIHGVVITSLDYVKRPEVVRALEGLIWDVLVFDEAHALAGRSDRATVASILAHRARTLLFLTATPHSGDDEAFARLASIGDFPPSHPRTLAPSDPRTLAPSDPRTVAPSHPHTFPLLVFRRTRLDVGLTSSRRTTSLRVRPTADELEMHSALMAYVRLVWTHASETRPAARLAMTILMRRACSSAWSLSRSLDTRLRLLSADEGPDLLQMALPFVAADEDDEPAIELGSPGLADRYEERRWLEQLLRLARLAERRESKFTALGRLLRRTREPAIVFTEYRDTLHRLADHLRDLAPALLHGGLTTSERQVALQQFVAGNARLLLATDAASEGLNLHHRCRLVINLELPWTPVRLEQRIGRVERLGQTKRVHAVHLLAAGTCEEESVAVLLARTRHVAGVLGGMRAESPSGLPDGSLPGGSTEQDPPYTAVSLPPGVVIGDLRAAARDEATRIERARSLAQGVRHPPVDRPCVTVLPSRHAKSTHWAYRVSFEDPDGQPVWQTIIGIGDVVSTAPRTSHDLRRWLESFDRLVEPVLTSASHALLTSLLSTLRAPLSLAIRRDTAIANELEHQRARLASALVQPGLFDRRAERMAATRNATLDEALARCADRRAELARKDQISFVRPRLTLGVIRR
jgi:superfamily II DNA or RNA helicase